MNGEAERCGGREDAYQWSIVIIVSNGTLTLAPKRRGGLKGKRVGRQKKVGTQKAYVKVKTIQNTPK